MIDDAARSPDRSVSVGVWTTRHPQNFLEPLFASYNAPPVGSNNTIYESAEFDAPVAAGNAAAIDGLDAALPDYQGAEDILCADVPAAPIYFRQNHFAIGRIG